MAASPGRVAASPEGVTSAPGAGLVELEHASSASDPAIKIALARVNPVCGNLADDAMRRGPLERDGAPPARSPVRPFQRAD